MNLRLAFVLAFVGSNHHAFAQDEGEESSEERSKMCMELMSSSCSKKDVFKSFASLNKKDKKCLISSSFGPIRSRCSNPGKYMFNAALTIPGEDGSMVKAVCDGEIMKSNLRKDTVVTKQKFSKKCMFNGKQYDTFSVYYGHVTMKDKTKTKVSSGEDFATLNKCTHCPHSFVLLKVKIGDSYVNPSGLFRKTIDNKKKFTLTKIMGKDKSMRVGVETGCHDTTVNKYDIRCEGKKPFYLDFNARKGFPAKDISKKPHRRNKQMPHIDPQKHAFSGDMFKTNLVIPPSYHGGKCCSVMVSDLWGSNRGQGSTKYCPTGGSGGSGGGGSGGSGGGGGGNGGCCTCARLSTEKKYYIFNVGNKGPMAVKGGSSANGVPIVQSDPKDEKRDVWYFEEAHEKRPYLSIMSDRSKKGVSVKGKSKDAGTAVIQMPTTTEMHDDWCFERLGKGQFKITNRKSGMVLDAADGNGIVQNEFKKKPSQLWKIKDIEVEGEEYVDVTDNE